MYAFAAAPRLDEKSAYYSRAARRGHTFLAPSGRGLSAKPTGGENCVLRLSLRHGLRPCHLPHRGRLDATALPWHTGRCTPRVLASLRGHRPLRKDNEGAVVKQRAGYPKGTRSASLHSVEPRPYTPNIEPHNSAFRSKSGSGKRSRDDATFRGSFHGTAFAWFILA